MANAFDALAPQFDICKPSSNKPCHDVFINHRGKDVKHKLASTIYNMLEFLGVPAFLDQDELELGESFPQAIEDAMRSASVHIAIFSPGYAESPWCLAELAFMFQINVTIIPVLYGVDPTDLRYAAKAKGIYAPAFVEHRAKGRYESEKIKEWEDALSRVSWLSGCIIEADKCDEGKLLKKIVDAVLDKKKKLPLEVARYAVGLDKAVQDFETKVGSSTGSQNVHIVGIVGIGGIGKTTLAKELYNRKCSSLSRSSFLYKVRDAASTNTLHNLQKNLLQDLGIKHSPFHNIHQGVGILARGLSSMTVLIVLDDIDDVDQMHALLPDEMMHNLGRGSFIIVTTREVDVLDSFGISSIYHMKLLDIYNSKQLFCRHAFLEPYSKRGFENIADNYWDFEVLIERFVEACNGLPLSLKVFGAMVNRKSKAVWESQLAKISRILPQKIAEQLNVSYDALDPELQKMFLDIACFFIGGEKSQVVAIWDGSGWSGEVGWETLENKCLVGIDENDRINMHDHLRDLGRQIARQTTPHRIWKEEQISVLGERTSCRGIVVQLSLLNNGWFASYPPPLEHFMQKIINTPSLSEFQLLAVRGNDFREEFAALSRNLVWLHWYDFHGTNLPSWLSFANIRVLELYNPKNLEELWQDNVQPPLQLRELIINLAGWTRFRGLPRSIGRLKHLKKIVLNGNDNGMQSLPEEICHLESLEFLELSDFPELSSLPDHFGKLINLRSLNLSGVQLTALPDSFGKLRDLRSLDLSGVQLTALPISFGQLTNLRTVDLWGVQLTTLPDSFRKLTNLRSLNLSGVQLMVLRDSFGELTNLQSLNLSGVQLKALPDTFGNLTNLQSLNLSGVQLKALSHTFGKLTNLQSLNLSGVQLKALPDTFGKLTNLQSLNLWGVQLRALPDAFSGLANLRNLNLWGVQLRALPDSFSGLTNLGSLDLSGVQLRALPDAFGELTNLKSLNLSGVQLKALPDAFGKLRSLQSLNLSRVQLRALPDSFGDLANLQSINLSRMPFRALPDSFGKLTNLQTLNLWGAQLTWLPDSFGKLISLRTIDFSGGQLRALPDSFGELTNLESVNLSRLQLKWLPDSFGKLINLRILNFWGEQLTWLPASLDQLTRLHQLYISNCFMLTPEMLHFLKFMTELQVLKITGCPQLEELPHLANQVSLRELHLTDSGLRELPNNIGQLTKLETLVIGSRNMMSLPRSLGELSSLTYLKIADCKMLESLPEPLGHLSNLESLAIYRTPVVEFGFGIESPWGCNLKRLKSLSLVQTLVCRISISDNCCPSLETLLLWANNNLTEIETLPGNVRELSVQSCRKMKNMMGIGGLLNLEILVVTDCPDLEVLPCPTDMHSVADQISISGCPKAERFFQDLGIGCG